jgi:hypothetical protein
MTTLYPSIMAHVLNGMLLFAAIIYIFANIHKIRALDVYRIIVIIILLSIGLGVHGISHLGLEKEYNYVPFDLWEIPQKPKMECPCMKKHGA